MNRYYLDNCATTLLSPAVAEAMAAAMAEFSGNPSSIHHEGRQAARALAAARMIVAESLGARPNEIVFTSSGTEAVNMAVRGVISRAMRTLGKARVVTSAVEHPSTNIALSWEKQVHKETLEIVTVPVDQHGLLQLDHLDAVLAEGDVNLITLLLLNNETGAIQDIDQLKQRKLSSPNVTWHLDVVQAYTKIPLDSRLLPFDMFTLSAHKIHGPKGIGALYIRGGTEIDPLILGGSQEKYRRAGTENLHGAVGFAAALKSVPSPAEIVSHLEGLEAAFLGELEAQSIIFQLNGPPDAPASRLPGFLNMSFPGVSSREDLQIALDLEGISLSSTSACHSGVVEESHVLKAMGLTGAALTGAIRLLFDYSNTIKDAKESAAVVSRVVTRMLQPEVMA